jgi:RNA polymerase sigma-70 factor (ECF subfamily)
MQLTRQQKAFAVLKAQSGDRTSLDDLFRSVQQALYRCIRTIVGDPDRAADVTQDVFVALQRNLKHLRDPELFDAWSYRIATREAIRAAAKARRLAGSVESLAPGSRDLPNPIEKNPLANLERIEVDKMLWNAPPASRAVLALHYIQDLPMPEVAGILDIPLGTAKSRLAYGLQFLRRRVDRADHTN